MKWQILNNLIDGNREGNMELCKKNQKEFITAMNSLFAEGCISAKTEKVTQKGRTLAKRNSSTK